MKINLKKNCECFEKAISMVKLKKSSTSNNDVLGKVLLNFQSSMIAFASTQWKEDDQYTITKDSEKSL